MDGYEANQMLELVVFSAKCGEKSKTRVFPNYFQTLPHPVGTD
jgi:hypothetical protein